MITFDDLADLLLHRSPGRKEVMSKLKRRALTVKLEDGETVHCLGEFSGEPTDRDIAAIRELANLLKQNTKADSIKALSLVHMKGKTNEKQS